MIKIKYDVMQFVQTDSYKVFEAFAWMNLICIFRINIWSFNLII